MSSAEGTPDTGLPIDFRRWTRDHVKKFLQDNKDGYGLDDEDIDLIYKQKILGRHFSQMTVQSLVTDHQLPSGVAVSIHELITVLINPPQSKFRPESTTLYHNTNVI